MVWCKIWNCLETTCNGLSFHVPISGDDGGALEDFKIAASLGNDFAKQMVVQLNPYAALCNQMLSEVIGKIRRGET